MSVFVLLVIFQLKHFIADYPLQAHPFFIGKFKKDWSFLSPLLAHVAIHGFLTFLVSYCWSAILLQALLYGLFDATVHFFMDRIKAGQRYMGRWKPLTGEQWLEDMKHRNDTFPRQRLLGNTLFWICLGFDQMVHHLTHYVVIWLLVR